jgi:hypothetical protein
VPATRRVHLIPGWHPTRLAVGHPGAPCQRPAAADDGGLARGTRIPAHAEVIAPTRPWPRSPSAARPTLPATSNRTSTHHHIHMIIYVQSVMGVGGGRRLPGGEDASRADAPGHPARTGRAVRGPRRPRLLGTRSRAPRTASPRGLARHAACALLCGARDRGASASTRGSGSADTTALVWDQLYGTGNPYPLSRQSPWRERSGSDQPSSRTFNSLIAAQPSL